MHEPVHYLEIKSIRLDEKFQPRIRAGIPYRDLHIEEKKRIENIDYLYGRLMIEGDLNPIHVGNINESLYVLDGWHRVHAYRAAKRESIPAIVEAMTEQEGIQKAALANMKERSLPLMKSQHTEAVWTWLMLEEKQGRIINRNGKCKHQSYSLRDLERLTSTPKSTIDRMLRRIGDAVEEEMSGEQNEMRINPATSRPYWKYMKLNNFPGLSEDFAPDKVNDIKTQRKFSAIFHKHCNGNEINFIYAVKRFISDFEHNQDDEWLPSNTLDALRHYEADQDF